MKKVICCFRGGLGNQMFQYAAAQSLASELNCSLVADLRFYDIPSARERFRLTEAFNLSIIPATPNDLKAIFGFRSSVFFIRVMTKLNASFAFPSSFYFEKQFGHDTGISNLTPPIYLYGYWQSEKYFARETESLVNAFSFRLPQNERFFRFSNSIQNSESIAVHIRRGDYITDKRSERIFNILSPDFYKSAVKLFQARKNNCKFFIFSDDIGWVKQNCFFPSNSTFVEFDDSVSASVDMYLFSKCKHAIISNSTFSWWGAWLNRSAEKIVVAPKLWFSPGSRLSCVDLIPASWIRI